MSRLPVEPNDALIVVDVQKDFCLGGTLPVDEADEIVPVLNRWIDAAQQCGARLIFTRDWHPEEHVSFVSQGGPWPRHCVRDTEGAEFHSELRVPEQAQIVSKGVGRDKDNYSAFDGTGLADQLKQEGVSRLWIGGLAQDVCVRATVLDACQAGFEVHVLADGTRPVDAQQRHRSLEEMQQAGAKVWDEG